VLLEARKVVRSDTLKGSATQREDRPELAPVRVQTAAMVNVQLHCDGDGYLMLNPDLNLEDAICLKNETSEEGMKAWALESALASVWKSRQRVSRLATHGQSWMRSRTWLGVVVG
jgi:hypothetical protein